ncbi:HAMP domain-containing sensor histidine kinase [Robbsia sp. Bb-Pol-6]|uniref:histidine kinase n=1 Tax=Robbsia betulipollinis TaxID=2981849 RepID=A0ABT3ZKA9_9BURK|nr:HAMP domain-containing sensor histidine kinase [Robbsia betulipollinis]MCY0386777.1 HAMP domain-containing sensor histidine kinase [Robbsia betulipollinis]
MIVKTLLCEQEGDFQKALDVSGKIGGETVAYEMRQGSLDHARTSFADGFPIDKLVHDFGSICQNVSAMAAEQGLTFTANEFRIMNRCLDNAIADAVQEFSHISQAAVSRSKANTDGRRFGAFVHELRNYIDSALLASQAMRAANLTPSSATGSLLDRSLRGLSALIDRTVETVRLGASGAPDHAVFFVSDFLASVCTVAFLAARERGCRLHVSRVDAKLQVSGDQTALYGAFVNLLQNAFKFTRPGSEVRLEVHAVGAVAVFDIKDQCGGLAPGTAERMFRPFEQMGADRSGLGLGLSIARDAIESSGGTIGVRDVPGVGCVFTVTLPRGDDGTPNAVDTGVPQT